MGTPAGGRGLPGALGLLTIVGRGAVPTRASLRWFPVVGAALGALLGACWWEARHYFPAAVASALVVALDLALTGMLHADGLVDSADGLLPHMERPRRLDVMAEAQVGAFGVVVLVAVVALRLAALGTMAPGSVARSVLLLGGIWTMSRSIMALATFHLPYVRPGGLASALLDQGSRADDPALRHTGSAVPITGVVVSVVALVLWSHSRGAGAAVAEAIGAGAVLLLARRRLGGYTGDVLGAAGFLGETLALVLASARW
ncbi:MAG TPA: adenosylcobinamide-GDP ribazoletransferase [Acidimicrobiales bacterium]|jgi:adenosylcobinamide-GDP ribazoletransferase|nr:adenosylcobinamide-GDP ribazoletransferase [Acidimicrobiales bacterium]